MSTYILIFMLLNPTGGIEVRADATPYVGADLCQANQEVLNYKLKSKLAKGEIFGFSSQCVDSKLKLGVPA